MSAVLDQKLLSIAVIAAEVEIMLLPSIAQIAAILTSSSTNSGNWCSSLVAQVTVD